MDWWCWEKKTWGQITKTYARINLLGWMDERLCSESTGFYNRMRIVLWLGETGLTPHDVMDTAIGYTRTLLSITVWRMRELVIGRFTSRSVGYVFISHQMKRAICWYIASRSVGYISISTWKAWDIVIGVHWSNATRHPPNLLHFKVLLNCPFLCVCIT